MCISKMAMSYGGVSTFEQEQKNDVRHVQTEGFETLGITGCQLVFNEEDRITFWRKVFWLLAILVSLVLVGWFMYDRISYYISEPIRANVQILETDGMDFPAITICNKNIWDREELYRFGKKLNLTGDPQTWNMSDVANSSAPLPELWEKVGYSQSDILKECWIGRDTKCKERGRWSQVFTVMGFCNTLFIDDLVKKSGIFYGLYMVIQDTTLDLYNRTESGFKVLIHDAHDYPTIAIRTHGFTLPLGWGKDVALRVTKLDTLDMKHRPCEDNPTYSKYNCVEQCFGKSMLNSSSCILPYIRRTGDMKGAPYCKNKSSYERAEFNQKRLIYNGEFDLKSCNCPRQCNRTEYSYSLSSEDVSEIKGPLASRLRIYFQHMTYSSMNEEKAYTMIQMFTEIGGTFGLLLGASLLTFIQVFDITCQTIKQKLALSY